MSGCKGLHCEGCSHHHGAAGAGLGVGALVVLIGVLELNAHRHAVTHAASDAAHVVVTVLAVAAVVLAAAVLTVGSAWVLRRRARSLAARQHAELSPLRAWVISPRVGSQDRPAIEERRSALPWLPDRQAPAETRREGQR